jgi:hypothetical protein
LPVRLRTQVLRTVACAPRLLVTDRNGQVQSEAQSFRVTRGMLPQLKLHYSSPGKLELSWPLDALLIRARAAEHGQKRMLGRALRAEQDGLDKGLSPIESYAGFSCSEEFLVCPWKLSS